MRQASNIVFANDTASERIGNISKVLKYFNLKAKAWLAYMCYLRWASVLKSRLIDFVYHSTLGLRVTKKKRRIGCCTGNSRACVFYQVKGS